MKIDYTRTVSGSELITTAQMKNYLRENYGTDATEDALVDQCVKSAREFIEEETQRSYVTQTIVFWAYDDNNLIEELDLPFDPVTEITEVVRIDEEGTETAQTLNTDYYVSGLNGKTLLFNKMWATGTSVSQYPIKVTYTAGYTTAPAPIVQANYKLAAESYVNREASVDWSINLIPYGVAQLIEPYKRYYW